MLPQSLCMELSWFHLLIFYVRRVICKILSLRIVHCRTSRLLFYTSIGFSFLSEDSLMFCAWNWGAIIKIHALDMPTSAHKRH